MTGVGFITEPERQVPVRYETQVLVVGGGSAGRRGSGGCGP
ncbi:MAG: hypothetical protein R3B97_12970 [Dehalococcoidia bacterium]